MSASAMLAKTMNPWRLLRGRHQIASAMSANIISGSIASTT